METEDFAVADFPTGRQEGKYYMFYQTIHGHPITYGHVSRTPENANAFLEANPLLGALHAQTPPDPEAELDIETQFDVLHSTNIYYIIIHKPFSHVTEAWAEAWPAWRARFPAPYYEDERIVVYHTSSTENEFE